MKKTEIKTNVFRKSVTKLQCKTKSSLPQSPNSFLQHLINYIFSEFYISNIINFPLPICSSCCALLQAKSGMPPAQILHGINHITCVKGQFCIYSYMCIEEVKTECWVHQTVSNQMKSLNNHELSANQHPKLIKDSEL